MRLEPQIETLYQTLNRELDNFPAGTKFYSVRKLMDKFKCHRGVLDEVLERLEANQLIDRIPQVGIFSSVTRRPNARKVLLVMPDWPGEVCREWRRKACAYADSHERWQLKEVIMPPDRNTIQFLSTENFDAAIIQMPSSNISREEMKFLAESENCNSAKRTAHSGDGKTCCSIFTRCRTLQHGVDSYRLHDSQW